MPATVVDVAARYGIDPRALGRFVAEVDGDDFARFFKDWLNRTRDERGERPARETPTLTQSPLPPSVTVHGSTSTGGPGRPN
jgi:hypothetical protein